MSKTVGEKIKEIRLQLEMSQDELAKKCGYKSRSSINKIETARDLPLKKVSMMAKALGVSEAYLMGWEDLPADKSTLALEAIKDSSKLGNFLYETTVVNKRNKNDFVLSQSEINLVQQWRNADDETKNMIMRILAFSKQGGNINID